MDDHIVYELRVKNGEILFRKIKDKNVVGICVTEKQYEFPFSTSAEQLLTKKQAEELIKSLQRYFNIK